MAKTRTYNYAHIKAKLLAEKKRLPFGDAITDDLEKFYKKVSRDGYILAVGAHDPETSPAVILTSPKNMPELNFHDYAPNVFLANMGTVTVEGGKKLPNTLKAPSVPLAVFKGAVARNIDVKDGCTLLTDEATATNATFKGNNTLAGETHVEGGVFKNLSSAGKNTIKTAGELNYCSLDGKVTIEGNISLTGINLTGDTYFTTATGGNPIHIKNGDGRSARAVYNLTHLKKHGKTFNYSFTDIYLKIAAQALKESPDVLHATLCMNHTVHVQNMKACRCALWYPLLRAADPVAMQYLVRAEGLHDPAGKTGNPLRDASLNNPLSSLSTYHLEESMCETIFEMEKIYDGNRWYEALDTYKGIIAENYAYAGIKDKDLLWCDLWEAYSK